MDCVLTAMIALAFWRANGRLRLDQSAMLHNTADWCLRNLDVADGHIEALSGLRAEMFARMVEQRDEAA